ncbi:hypothetical protein C8R45DRAFT_1081865 [Mycena sanguinolenta]|nr:hypothetical protein C8R45DRAFT_1081865 [Mycena sanguinolenta]
MGSQLGPHNIKHTKPPAARVRCRIGIQASGLLSGPLRLARGSTRRDPLQTSTFVWTGVREMADGDKPSVLAIRCVEHATRHCCQGRRCAAHRIHVVSGYKMCSQPSESPAHVVQRSLPLPARHTRYTIDRGCMYKLCTREVSRARSSLISVGVGGFVGACTVMLIYDEPKCTLPTNHCSHGPVPMAQQQQTCATPHFHGFGKAVDALVTEFTARTHAHSKLAAVASLASSLVLIGVNGMGEGGANHCTQRVGSAAAGKRLGAASVERREMY